MGKKCPKNLTATVRFYSDRTSTVRIQIVRCPQPPIVAFVTDLLLTVPTHGDCLAVERMVDANRAQLADLTSYTRLEGLEPVPQEFHHQALMLQVNS